MKSVTLRQNSGESWLRIALATCLAMLLAVGALVTSAPVAHGQTHGVDIAVLHNGTEVEDGAVIPEGSTLLLRIQYNANEDLEGQEVVVSVPSNISINHVPPGTEAIESIIDNGDGTITIKFHDEIPDSTAEGALAVNLNASEVDGDESSEISWVINDQTTTVWFVIENNEAPPTVVEDGYSKGVSPSTLDSFVVRSTDGNFTFVGLDDEIVGELLTYTIIMHSGDARADGLVVADSVNFAGLAYVADSFAAELTTYNPQTTVEHDFAPTITGASFSGTLDDVPANSTVRITYQVEVTDKAALEAAVQDAYDVFVEDNPHQTGHYELFISNAVTFNGDNERVANVRIRGNVPGVGVGNAFGKTGDWSYQELIADDEGNLTPPAEMTYSFRANLSVWNEQNPNFVLNQNVVIRDELIPQAQWLTGDADFITVTDHRSSGSSPVTEFTAAATCPAMPQDFAGDEFVGRYCITVNEETGAQILLINVGDNDPSDVTDITVHVKAQLNSVAGLEVGHGTTIVDAESYLWPNSAAFYYRDGSPHWSGHDANVVVWPNERDGGINDWTAFLKGGPSGDVRVNPGERAEVPYRFTIDTSKQAIDPLTSTIVDYVDSEIFDITDLSAIGISGSYDGVELNAEHFNMSLNDENNLDIRLSADGIELVEGLPEGAIWIIDVVLVTVPFDGKETFEIHNHAVLFGFEELPLYWSDDDSEATSFGDEAELRKRVYDDIPGEWTAELNAQIDENGEFINDIFVYRIEFIPRGSYGSAFPVSIYTFVDNLPEEVEFLGFVNVDDEDAPLLDTVDPGPVDLAGNLRAHYADGVVTVEQTPGTSLDSNGGAIATYFAVRGLDADGPIINRVGNSSAIIDPYGVPSIDIEKWNDEGDAPAYGEDGALLNDGYEGDFDAAPGKELAADVPLPINFTVSNDGREDLVDIVVTDELVDGTGAIQDLVCVFPDESTGTTWAGVFEVGTQFECFGTLPGLSAGDVHSNLAAVTGVGVHSGINVHDQDEWNAYVPVEDEEIPVEESDADADSNSETLPVTGANAATLAVLVPFLLLIGGIVMVVAHRRKLAI